MLAKHCQLWGEVSAERTEYCSHQVDLPGQLDGEHALLLQLELLQPDSCPILKLLTLPLPLCRALVVAALMSHSNFLRLTSLSWKSADRPCR